MKGRRILVGAVQMLLQTGMRLGLDRASLLEAAGLRESDLTDRDAYLPFARQVALGRALIDRRPGVNVALTALSQVAPSDFGLLGYVVTHAGSLRGALDAFIRFQRLLTDGVRWTVDVAEACTVTVDADPAYERLGYPIEALVGLWLTLGRNLTGQVWTPLAVRFRHPPLGDPAEIERHFGVRVEFGAVRSELVLSHEVLALPLVVGRAALAHSVRQLAEARLAEVDGKATLTARLRDLMFERVPRGVTGKRDFARAVRMSERTLDRRLKEEGTTFGRVLDGMRRDLALSLLGDPRHAVHEVAYLLGYSEPSTFHRSFRRWTGGSPRTWRGAGRGG